MSDRYVIIAGVQHDDGSLSNRAWTPVTPTQIEQVAELLGEAAYSTHVPTDAAARLLPGINSATIVYRE